MPELQTLLAVAVAAGRSAAGLPPQRADRLAAQYRIAAAASATEREIARDDGAGDQFDEPGYHGRDGAQRAEQTRLEIEFTGEGDAGAAGRPSRRRKRSARSRRYARSGKSARSSRSRCRSLASQLLRSIQPSSPIFSIERIAAGTCWRTRHSVDDVHDAVGVVGPLELADLLDIAQCCRRDVDQVVAHDGPELLLRTLEHDKAAECFQSGSPRAARKR